MRVDERKTADALRRDKRRRGTTKGHDHMPDSTIDSLCKDICELQKKQETLANRQTEVENSLLTEMSNRAESVLDAIRQLLPEDTAKRFCDWEFAEEAIAERAEEDTLARRVAHAARSMCSATARPDVHKQNGSYVVEISALDTFFREWDTVRVPDELLSTDAEELAAVLVRDLQESDES
jgi:hypothetical protein